MKFDRLKALINFKSFYWVYLVSFGLFFVFKTPVMVKHDEYTHYKRVVSIVSGQLICQDNRPLRIPSKFVSFADGMALGQLYPKEHYSYKFPNFDNSVTEEFNGCSLFFLGYIPNSFGFLIGNTVSALEPFTSFYFARFFGFIFFIFCLVIAYRNIRDKTLSTLLMIVSLVPMLINQVTAISYDGALISLSILLFSWLIKILESGKSIILQDKIIFIILIIVSISLKPVAYFPFVLLYFLVPYKKICSSLKEYLFISSIYIVFILAYYLIYLKFGVFTGPIVSSNSNEFYYTHFQRLLLRKDPLYFLSVFIDSIRLNSLKYFQSIISSYYFGTTLLTRVMYSFIFGGLLIYVVLKSKYCLLKINKISLFSLFGLLFGVFLLLSLTLYLSFSELSSNVISGVQGRYFIPILPYLFLFFYLLCHKIRLTKVLHFIFLVVLGIVFWETTLTLYDGMIKRSDFVRRDIVSSFMNEVEQISADNIRYISVKNKKNIVFNVKNNIYGLVLYHDNENQLYKVPQKWLIKDGNCKKTLRSGYFQIDKLNESKFYEITFRKIQANNNSICFSVEPLEIFENENYLRIGYLDDKPLFSLFILPEYKIEIHDHGLSFNDNLNVGIIDSKTNLYQTFLAEENYLTGVNLLFATYTKTPDVLYDFVLLDESCLKEIERIPIDNSRVNDLAEFNVYFDSIEDSAQNKYCFTVETKNNVNEISNPLTIEMSKPNIYLAGDLFLGGKKVNEDLIFKILYKVYNY